MKRFLPALFLCTALILGVWSARANTLPSQANLLFQTSSRDRPPGIGDWYTTSTSASTDRVHRILIEVSQGLLDQNGGSVNIQVFDAENNASLDEVDGTVGGAGTGDPARYELRGSNGSTVLQSQTVPSGAADGTTLSFVVFSPGSYQLVIVNGAFPINGDTNPALNNDDNTYSVSIPGNSTLIGQFQGTFSATVAIPTLNYYFLVGPGQSDLRLRNFDMDNTGTVSYTRPAPPAGSGATIAGTVSGNGVWNNGGSLNAGEDTVPIAQLKPFPDAGQWGLTVVGMNANNQFALEANAGTDRLIVLDQPPGTADAGNFRLTPSGILSGAIGTPTNHPFGVNNFFFTNDIVNFTLSGTSPNFSVQLLDGAGVPLVDTDQDGNLDSGILRPNESRNYILRVTPTAGAGAFDNTRVTGLSLMDARVVTNVTSPQTIQKVTQLSNAGSVSGTIYGDFNQNSLLDGQETGYSTSGFFVKLVPAAGGNAVAVAPVDSNNGTYILPNIAAGNYNLVLDDNTAFSDTTPAFPVNTAGSEAPNGVRSIVVGTTNLANQNFGRYIGTQTAGSTLVTGRVFRDDGAGGGTANNGILDGGETGIVGAQVRLQSADGATTYDTRTTSPDGSYSLNLPAGITTPVRVVETNLASYRSTGAGVGTSGGTYSLATDAITFTPRAGFNTINLNFSDVPPSQFTVDNSRTAAPGEVVVMPHVFTAGTAGSLAFTLSAVSNPATGWSNLLYLDQNGDGILQPTEPQIVAPINVTAGQKISVLTKVFTPLGAPKGSDQTLTVGANLTYANAPAVVESLSRTDLVTLSAGSGLFLTKAVDKATARAGEDITYTLTYRNGGNEPLGSIALSDTTPTYTVFRSAVTGALPAGITAPTTSFPAVGASGPLKWTFGGTLAPGASGTVTFVVRLQ